MDIWYQLDREGRILAVSPDFDRFSRENGGPADLSSSTIGKPLYEFVTGEATRHLIKLILAEAEKGTVRIQMRCDSPQELRLLEMQVTPDLRISFTTLRSQPRRRSILPQAGELVRLCSWCNTFETPQGWLTLEQAANLLQLLEGPAREISHGICPRCDRAFEDEHFGHLEEGFQD